MLSLPGVVVSIHTCASSQSTLKSPGRGKAGRAVLKRRGEQGVSPAPPMPGAAWPPGCLRPAPLVDAQKADLSRERQPCPSPTPTLPAKSRGWSPVSFRTNQISSSLSFQANFLKLSLKNHLDMAKFPPITSKCSDIGKGRVEFLSWLSRNKSD